MKIKTSKSEYICKQVMLAVVNSILTLTQFCLFYLLIHIVQGTVSILITCICFALLVWSVLMTLKSYSNVIEELNKWNASQQK